MGGFVRDLLLGHPNLDVDVAVEGEAIALATELANSSGAKLEVADRFGTASLKLGPDLPHFDFITARSETYAAPGALPDVQPGAISDDLARRDFTINAMAIPVGSGQTGALLDPHNGLLDLEAGTVRVLHDRSFIDDPTRLFRAVKYAGRLGFAIAPDTLELVFRAVRDGAISTVSMDRITHELLLIMEEAHADTMLEALQRYGVLGAIHPLLARPFEAGGTAVGSVPRDIKRHLRRNAYLAILGAEFAGFPDDAKAFARYLSLDARLTRLVVDSSELANRWSRLGEPGLTPSQVYHLLHGLDLTALEAFTHIRALSADEIAWGHLHDYLGRLRHIKTLLGGDYLRELGVPPGPVYREILGGFLNAKLNGEVRDHEDEEAYIKKRLAQQGL